MQSIARLYSCSKHSFLLQLFTRESKDKLFNDNRMLHNVYQHCILSALGKWCNTWRTQGLSSPSENQLSSVSSFMAPMSNSIFIMQLIYVVNTLGAKLVIQVRFLWNLLIYYADPTIRNSIVSHFLLKAVKPCWAKNKFKRIRQRNAAWDLIGHINGDYRLRVKERQE